MITLKAQNSNLTINTKYSYLSSNFLSGEDTLIVTSSEGFSPDDYVLVGEWGSETSEILKIASIATATHAITFTVATKWSHAESTKITIVKYNQVRFYHTVDTTFTALNPVTDYIDIQPDSLATIGYDLDHDTGYGWFVFYNETVDESTQNSNAIPYAGFAENTVKAVLDNFFSILNNKDLRLIDTPRAISWMNEGYTIMCSELNLINDNYNSELNYEITTAASLAEYSLPTKFGTMLTVWDDENNCTLPYISPSKLNNNENDNNIKSYYLRAGYLGLSPTPTDASVYKMTYTANASSLSSYDDVIDLPNGAFYALKDFMMFRAAPKLNKGDGSSFYKLFQASIERLKMTSIKQESNNDSWGIAPEANV